MASPVLQKLFDRIREIADSPRNQAVLDIWGKQPKSSRDHWRGLPQASSDSTPMPFTIQPEMALWSKIIGFDLAEFYTNPLTYLENMMRITIFRYEKLPDYTPVNRQILIWMGVSFEPSFFGQTTVYSASASPWIGKRPILHSSEDYKRLEKPDFHRDGLMPLAHRFYEELSETLPEDFSLAFPDWSRSPYAVAFHLRGMDNLVADMLQEPENALGLIDFLIQCRKEWSLERAAFLNQPLGAASLYNDECNCPILSPRLYENIVLSGEQELSNFYGGISYWHSCGNTTELIPLIARIPNLGLFHIGPWTDIATAVNVLPANIGLEICLDPVDEIHLADAASMRQRLKEIRSLCSGRAYTVRADGMQLLHTMQREMDQMHMWLEIAHEVLGINAVDLPKV